MAASNSPNGSPSPTRDKSSLKCGNGTSDDEEEKPSVSPKNVEFTHPERNGLHQFHEDSPPSSVSQIQMNGRSSNSKDNADRDGWLLMPYPKDIKRLSDAEASKLTNAETSSVYVVIKEVARAEAVGAWDQVISKIQGVYQSERDANNKVLSMYHEAEVNIRHQIRLGYKGQGSPFYRWETAGQMVDGILVRVHVERCYVRPESNEPEKVPQRRVEPLPIRVKNVKSMLDV
jgi:hypothetical protein